MNIQDVIDLKTARRCIDFKNLKCDNKDCSNKHCPLNKFWDNELIKGDKETKWNINLY